MSTTSNQHQRGGRRQPFGFLNANTLPSPATATKSIHSRSSSDEGSVGIAASASHSYSDPVKDESRKSMSRILTSIFTRDCKGREQQQRDTKNERERTACGSSDEDGGELSSPLESPTKKSRVAAMEEDSKLGAEDAIAAVATMPSTRPEDGSSKSSMSEEFAAISRSELVASVFRQPPVDANNFWNDEMDDMLELRLANPISDDDESDHHGEDCRVYGSQQGKADHPSAHDSLTRELIDEKVSGEPISWSNRLQEDEDIGFNIHVDQ